MKSKIGYTKVEWEEFHKSLNKAVTVLSMRVKELGDAFAEVAKILRDDKFYKAICEANEYIEGQEKIK